MNGLRSRVTDWWATRRRMRDEAIYAREWDLLEPWSERSVRRLSRADLFAAIQNEQPNSRTRLALEAEQRRRESTMGGQGWSLLISLLSLVVALLAFAR